MQFEAYVRVITTPVTALPLPDIWNFRDYELSPIAKKTLKLFEDSSTPFATAAGRAGVIAQAILEFQDLVGMPLPRHGRYVNVNYLFFEGLSALREATLCGCSGLVHASLATLRSALEMFILHEWWRARLFFAENHEDFYEWLEGKRRPPPFRNALETNFKSFGEVPGLIGLAEASDIYELLCNYSHRPLLEDSTVRMRGGNQGAVPSIKLMKFWIDNLERVTKLILHQMLAARPECLFPVEQHRKFGFNKPVGLFFDKYNFFPIESALGRQLAESLRTHFSNHDIVVSLRDWFESMPDLTDDEVLETWDDKPPKRDGSSIAERIFIRNFLQKANGRALVWSFAYGSNKMADDLALPTVKLPPAK